MMCNDRDETMCDEEKSYHEWVSKNIEYIQQNKSHVSVMKKLYMQGFAAGFQYSEQLRSHEYFQK